MLPLLCVCARVQLLNIHQKASLFLVDYIWGNYSNSLFLDKQQPSGAEGLSFNVKQSVCVFLHACQLVSDECTCCLRGHVCVYNVKQAMLE